jgi:hypothetical protein
MSELEIKIKIGHAPKNPRVRSQSDTRYNYRTEDGLRVAHIPVGMNQALWLKLLDRSELNSRFVHARWCGRRIASYLITLKRGGAMNWRGGHADQLDVEGVLEAIRLDRKLMQRLGIMQVQHELIPYAYQYARKVLGERMQREVQA